MNKIWTEVKFNKNYLVSNYGEVFSQKTNIFLKPIKIKNGSLQYHFPNRRIAAHKLVFTHFRNAKLIKYKHLVMHTDYNRQNNKEPNLERMSHGDVLRKWNEYKKKKRGVYPHSQTRENKDGSFTVYNRWRAVLKHNGKVKTLGYFDSRSEAEAAYFEGYKMIYGSEPY